MTKSTVNNCKNIFIWPHCWNQIIVYLLATRVSQKYLDTVMISCTKIWFRFLFFFFFLNKWGIPIHLDGYHSTGMPLIMTLTICTPQNSERFFHFWWWCGAKGSNDRTFFSNFLFLFYLQVGKFVFVLA